MGTHPRSAHLRPATAADVQCVADVYLRSRAASVPAIPPGVHDDRDVREWVATVLFANAERLAGHELWVAVDQGEAVGEAVDQGEAVGEAVDQGAAVDEAGDVGGAVIGFMVLAGDWIGHLYLGPESTGHGVGTALVQLAQRRRPDGLQLWTFASNAGARRFYERHGFVTIGGTNGTNEEGAPDVHYRWLPRR